jgi:hypothetical protein
MTGPSLTLLRLAQICDIIPGKVEKSVIYVALKQNSKMHQITEVQKYKLTTLASPNITIVCRFPVNEGLTHGEGVGTGRHLVGYEYQLRLIEISFPYQCDKE